MPPGPVVSNASPLVGLSVVGHLELLREFYSEVWIPPAVWQEVVESGADKAGSPEVAAAAAAGWLRVADTVDRHLVAVAGAGLGAGEAEAITLALSNQAALLIIDEAKGRRRAMEYNLTLTGVVGILTQAARDGIIDTLQADLDHLRQAEFRISARLYQQALRAARPATN